MFWFLVCFYLEEMWIFVLKEASITVLLKCIYFAFSAIYWDMNGFSVIKQGLKPPYQHKYVPSHDDGVEEKMETIQQDIFYYISL